MNEHKMKVAGLIEVGADSTAGDFFPLLRSKRKLLNEASCVPSNSSCVFSNGGALGDGICDAGENTAECCYGDGDCLRKSYGGCTISAESCPISARAILDDGTCDNFEPYNTLACCWDGGDCRSPKQNFILGIAVGCTIFGLILVACFFSRMQRRRAQEAAAPAFTESERLSLRRQFIFDHIDHKVSD
jgi:hypothetical protein